MRKVSSTRIKFSIIGQNSLNAIGTVKYLALLEAWCFYVPTSFSLLQKCTYINLKAKFPHSRLCQPYTKTVKKQEKFTKESTLTCSDPCTKHLRPKQGPSEAYEACSQIKQNKNRNAGTQRLKPLPCIRKQSAT